MTVDEVAELLDVSRWTVSRGCQNGDFPGATQTAANRAWDIPRASFNTYVAARTAGGTDPKEADVDSEFRAYPLEHVAEETGISLRWIQDQVRAKKVRHLRTGRKPMMTATHMRALLEYAETRTTQDEALANELAYQQSRRGRRRSAAKAA